MQTLEACGGVRTHPVHPPGYGPASTSYFLFFLENWILGETHAYDFDL